MSDDTRKSKQPSHHAFQVKEVDDKSYFNRVGVAFEHKDRKGFNIQLDSMPVNGRITLRTPKERLDEGHEPRREQEREHEQ